MAMGKIQDRDVFTYKSASFTKKLPTCTLKLEDLNRIFEVLNDGAREAGELEVKSLRREGDQTVKEFEDLKKYAKNLFVTRVVIIGAKEEYIQTDSPSVFSPDQLPPVINQVIFDTSLKYKALEQNRFPMNWMRVTFDFGGQVKIFDFRTAPTAETLNNSLIEAAGTSETWVRGTTNRVLDVLGDRSNKRGFLHNHSVFNILIWLFAMPLSIWYAQRVEGHYSGYFNQRMLLGFALYIYFVLTICNIFMILFNYARWVFPYAELEGYSPSKCKAHRYILGVIFFSIVSGLIYDIGNFLL